MTIVQTVTTNVLHRAWSDLEPKLLTFLATGVSAGIIIKAANYVGYAIDPGLAVVLSTIIAAVFGYLKSSTTKVLTPVAIGAHVSAPVAAPAVYNIAAPVDAPTVAPAVTSAPAEVVPPAL